MSQTAEEEAFDAAVHEWDDPAYPSRADLNSLGVPTALPTETLVQIRELFNQALAVEGQHIKDHAPHPPFYFDYIESQHSNAFAFTDSSHSFIGVTIPLLNDALVIAATLAASDSVVACIGTPTHAKRQGINDALFWLLVNFVMHHEYTHHVHGHLRGTLNFDVEEMVGGALTGNLGQQALEADADGYAAYFSFAFWLLDVGGRNAAFEMLQVQHLDAVRQDQVLYSAFMVAAAGFTFLREPEALDEGKAYQRTHPPQPLRMHLLTRFVRKWCSEFRPALHTWMSQTHYQALMDAVSAAMWTNGTHAAGWHAQAEFLRTPEGVQYRDALIAELDRWRLTTLPNLSEVTG